MLYVGRPPGPTHPEAPLGNEERTMTDACLGLAAAAVTGFNPMPITRDPETAPPNLLWPARPHGSHPSAHSPP
jgi:hypothetical protein